MAISKPKKPEKPKNPKPDIELLKSDVASFASSIGLSTAASSSGFNDSDFRKKSSLKLQKPQKSQSPNNKKHHDENADNKNKNNFNNKKSNIKKVPNKYTRTDRPSNSTLSPGDSRPIDRWNNLPKLPLMNASSLGVWFVDAAELELKVMGTDGKRIEVKNSEEWNMVVAKKKELAERLMSQYTQDFEASRGNIGDIKMLMATQRSGTAADKVSAFSVLVGENPIANMRSLDALLAMVTSKVGKRHALSGFEVLKELFLSSLLPDRKLKLLIQRPLNHLPESKDGNSLLLFWYWEECLKQRYERFVFALEEASRDMLPVLKDKSLKTLYALLRSKSEQERRLLSALVNKLGDPENKAASNADFYLSGLLSDHPNMKEVVINEVDAFLFRPHLNLRAKYHAVNFLSQIRLSHKGDGPKVAKRLVDVYFALFKLLISNPNAGEEVDQNDKTQNQRARNAVNNIKRENVLESTVEMDSRILSALLTGVNRAFPYLSSAEADDVIEVQTPMLFKLVHSKNFNVGVQALMLLDKLSTKNQIVSDRFYRALYSKLLLPAVMHSSKAEMFIGLLLRAMKSDVNLKRVSAFSKRLLQVALQQPPQFACGCLFLLSEVLKARPPLWNTVLQSESVDTDLEHFEDVKEEPESEARSAQSIDCDDNDHVKTDSNSSASEEEMAQCSSDSDDDDLDIDRDLLGNPSSNDVEVAAASGHSKGQSQASNTRLPSGYNPRHREPSYCNAECASWWELTVLASHVHPSVATMARTLLSGTNIVYNGNPLNDLSLTAFLDKFMEKKPKQTTWHGGSQIEPAKKLDTTNHLIGPEILSLAETDVPPEDLVFHKFYINKMASSKKPQKKKKKKKGADAEINEELLGVDEGDESDEEIGGDESDNEEIENMLDPTDGPLEPEGDYDYDDLDRVANDEDEDLIGSGSDAESDIPSDLTEEPDDTDDEGGENSQVVVKEAYEHDGKHKKNKRKRNMKFNKKSGESPFASLEDYDHLLNDNVGDSTRKKKPKLGRKRRSSD